MIITNKYKNSIRALTQLASEMNPAIGAYESHYLNKDIGFTVKLSNGTLEIPVDVASSYEKNRETFSSHKLRKVALSYNNGISRQKLNSQIETEWKNLFKDPTQNISS